MSQTSTQTMKAVNYQGAFKVKVEDVPMPKLEHPDDVIVKVTTAGKLLVVSDSVDVWCPSLGLGGRIE
jgi:hypothetical protein